MKKLLISTLLLLLCITTGYAQQKVYIHLNDGTKLEYYVWQIDSINFEEDVPLTTPATAEYVDLGLSVKWANFNLGAETESGLGFLVGWGDITGKNHSTELKYFPVEEPTGHIVAGKYDIATQLWKDQWRLPTTQEIQELIDDCNWEWETVDGVGGYRVSGKAEGTGNIFLPVTGKRSGETTSDDTQGFYWSGMLNMGNVRNAMGLNLSESEKMVIALERYLGLAIRPVYGKYVVPVTVTLNEPTSINYTNVKLGATLGGDYQDVVTSYGIFIAKSIEALDMEATSTKRTDGKPTSDSFSYTFSYLEEGGTYYYCAFAQVNGAYVYSDTLSVTLLTHFPVPEYVDLGLSVKWAKWNMGASNDKEVGGYYGWGDNTGSLKSSYNSDYAKGNTSTNIAGTNYDLAYVKWGGKWRMPSQAEYDELVNKCTWTFTRNYEGTGISGYIVNGKPGSGMENNTIFFPRAGYETIKGSKMYWDSDADYWTSECQEGSVKAYYVTLKGATLQKHTSDKNVMIPIRAIYAEATSGSSGSGSGTGGDTPGGDTPGGDTPGGDTPGGNTNIKVGTAVDLGLSVKWADINVGAEYPSDYGNYYAWGETEPKNDYSFENYSFHIEGTTDKNKKESYVDIGTDIKGTEYDVAHVKWGGTWRMPSEKEVFELINKCTWDWTDGGYKITGPSGKSIFLPAVGFYNGTNLSGEFTQAKYWTSAVNEYKDTYYAYGRDLYFVYSTNDHNVGSHQRFLGCAIRPVKP